MEPESTKDMNTLIAMLNLSTKQALDSNEQNRRAVDEMNRKVIVQEERLMRVSEDNKDLRLELRERSEKLESQISKLETNLLLDQKKRTSMIIGSQATVLIIIIGSFISYIFLFLPKH